LEKGDVPTPTEMNFSGVYRPLISLYRMVRNSRLEASCISRSIWPFEE
jgi:hypothetical protein